MSQMPVPPSASADRPSQRARARPCVFRTLDDLVDDGHPDAWARVGRVARWCEDGVAASREARALQALDVRHGLLLSPEEASEPSSVTT